MIQTDALKEKMNLKESQEIAKLVIGHNEEKKCQEEKVSISPIFRIKFNDFGSKFMKFLLDPETPMIVMKDLALQYY